MEFDFDLSHECQHATITACSRGVGLLDTVFPDWWQSINPDTLDCTSGRHNVLGQIYGTSEQGRIMLGSGAGDRDFLFHHGFCVNSLENWKEQARLVDTLWRMGVSERKNTYRPKVHDASYSHMTMR